MDLNTLVIGNTLLAWIGALGTTLLLAAVILAGQPLLLRFARRFAARTPTAWDDAVVEALARTRLDRVHFAAPGESSLDFEVVYWLLEPAAPARPRAVSRSAG